MESASYDVDMDLDIEDEKVNMGISGGYLEKDGKLNLSVIVDATSEEETMDQLIEVYYKDDHMYLQMLGDQYQTDLSELLSSMSPADKQESQDTKSTGFKKADIEPYLTKASMDGNKIHLEFDTKKVQEAMTEAIAEAEKNIGYDITAKVKKTTADIEIKDDFIVDATIDFDINMIVKDESNQSGAGDMQLSFHVAFDDINQNKELKFPDFKDYQEVDLFTLIGELSSMGTNTADMEL